MWAVSAKEVRALAAQHAPQINADPDYGASLRSVGDEDITAWITEVSAVVDVKLRKRSKLAPANLVRVMAAGKTVVKVGAAAYLVDAAAPIRAGVGDNSSYGHVLWTRYQTELDDLVAAIDEWVNDGGGDEEGSPPRSGGAGSFQTPIFPDELTW